MLWVSISAGMQLAVWTLVCGVTGQVIMQLLTGEAFTLFFGCFLASTAVCLLPLASKAGLLVRVGVRLVMSPPTGRLGGTACILLASLSLSSLSSLSLMAFWVDRGGECRLWWC